MTVTNVELLKLGLRIRASRKVLGWTQKRFSSNCGLDRSYFGGVERGTRNMTFSVLCQICDSLSCDIATVTKGIPHLQTVGGSKACNFQKPGKMGSEKEREMYEYNKPDLHGSRSRDE
jgi:transcriptional regulator with XRE-family HTH domain